MNTVENDVLQAAESVIPDAPIVQAAEAAIATAADPSPVTIMSDLELAMNLIKRFKADLAGLHPTISSIIKELF